MHLLSTAEIVSVSGGMSSNVKRYIDNTLIGALIGTAIATSISVPIFWYVTSVSQINANIQAAGLLLVAASMMGGMLIGGTLGAGSGVAKGLTAK